MRNLPTIKSNEITGSLSVVNEKLVYLVYTKPNGEEINDYTDCPQDVDAIVNQAQAFCLNAGLILWSY